MATRATMAALISRVRLLVGDPAGTTPTFTDEQLQDFLDRTRLEARYLELEPVETRTVATSTWLTYLARVGDWETDSVLVDSQYVALTPSTADWAAGRWTFTTQPTWPVRLTGWTHDVNLAAATVCDAWVAIVKAAYDFTTDGQTFHRSQQVEHLDSLANQFRSQRRTPAVLSMINPHAATSKIHRSDLQPWR